MHIDEVGIRTNIEIDNKHVADTKETGLGLVARHRVYHGLLALRGKLHWYDSDEGWAKAREQQALLGNDAASKPNIAQATPSVLEAAPAKRGCSK